MKKIIAILISLAFILFLSKTALAVNLSVTCDGTDCVMSPSPGAALFEEEDMKPGYNIPRKITITNTGEEDCLLRMATKNENDPFGLSQVLFTAIDDGTTPYFGTNIGGQATSDKSLWDLFAQGEIDLSTVTAGGGPKDFNWIVTMDVNAGNEYQAKTVVFDFDLYFTCGEIIEDVPHLVLTKDNDRKGQTLYKDDIVIYTITVTNDGLGMAYNVWVKDVQPVGEYFDYFENSGFLTCTGEAGIPLTATGANPYLWPLGNMDPGEVCTLTYQMQITDDSIPGEHNNIALAFGLGGDGTTYYSEPVIDPFDVGYKRELSAGYEGEVEEEREGEVLGAAIGEVLGAATGSKTFWLVISLLMIIVGITLRFNKRLAKLIKGLFTVLLFAALLMAQAKPVQAADTQPPVVAIVQLPEHKKDTSFEISYTALDVGEAGLKNVRVEYKKEGSGYQTIGVYTEHSRKVSIDGSQIDEDKKYYFKATACDNENNCAFDETFTTIDTTSPPKPENYSKEKQSSGYKLKWHNPDNDDIYQVYVYRSEDKDYDANDSTKIAEIGVAKDTDTTWINSLVPDPNKDYYYALRSVDKAGNASDLVGDTYTTYIVTGEAAAVEAPTGVAVTGKEAIPGEEPIAGGVPVEEAVAEGEILGEEEEEATEEAEEELEEAVLGEEVEGEERLPWDWLILGIVFIFSAAGYYYFYYLKREQE